MTPRPAAVRADEAPIDGEGRGARCPACEGPGMEVFHRASGVPVNSCLLVPTLEEATRFPRGRLEVAFCHGCGFISNLAFDPALTEYSSRYEETQAFSPRFVTFARELAGRWVDRYGLTGGSVLEIGCGKGEFLTMMVEAGVGQATGIDPGARPERLDPEVARRITWITDFYSERYAHLAADAVVCRHTLEHIPDVGRFMRSLRASLGDRRDVVVLFELPDVLRVLREVAFWDVYYEHCSYFSAGSLARLFRRTGFEVLDLGLEYDDQYLVVDARPSVVPATDAPRAIEDDLEALGAAVGSFRAGYEAKVTEWADRLRRVTAGGGQVAIWGAGSKGVAFLTTLTGLAGAAAVTHAVDINPYKHGMYMAGTGHRIVPPAALRDAPPDLVVAMNAVYLDEIRGDLEALGVGAELVAV